MSNAIDSKRYRGGSSGTNAISFSTTVSTPQIASSDYPSLTAKHSFISEDDLIDNPSVAPLVSSLKPKNTTIATHLNRGDLIGFYQGTLEKADNTKGVIFPVASFAPKRTENYNREIHPIAISVADACELSRETIKKIISEPTCKLEENGTEIDDFANLKKGCHYCIKNSEDKMALMFTILDIPPGLNNIQICVHKLC